MTEQIPNNDRMLSPWPASPAPVSVSDLIWVFTALLWIGSVDARAVAVEDAAAALIAAGQWPQFRGPCASGVADGQNLPDHWDGVKGENVRWKKSIPGLAHSSPIIWGNQLFVTTAVSSQENATFRPGLYGDGDASNDRSPHRWLVLCLDKRNGEVLWERVPHEGVPKDKRHVKATYANSTPASDGKRVVAFFGSEGVFAYDVEGKLLWKKDLGRLEAGAYDTRSYEWGTASSPILYRDRVIVQCDVQEGSFITALNAQTGEIVWRAERKELPSWGTPNVYSDETHPELIVNGSNFIRGYDPATGRELWRLGGSSKITAPTPIFAEGLVIVTSGRAPERPIFAIRPGATGNITLESEQTTNRFIAWSKVRKGPYMPTPLIYQNRLYVVNNQGLFDCYELETGREIFGERIQHRGSGFSASPVAADGRLYVAGEDGDVFVYAAGAECKLLAQNPMGEPMMATPALSKGTLFIRGQQHLFAVGKHSQLLSPLPGNARCKGQRPSMKPKLLTPGIPMKNVIRDAIALAVLSAFASVGVCADNPPAGYIDFGKFSPPTSGGEFVEVHIKSNLISMAARLVEKSEPDVAELIRGLQLIRVNVIGLDDGNRADIEKRIKKIRGELDAQGWERIVTAQKKDEDVGVYLKTRGSDAVEGLVVTVIEGNREAVLINIVGDIKPDKIAIIGERMNIEPLKKAGEALKKK